MLQVLEQLLLQWDSQLHHREEICLALDQVATLLTNLAEQSVRRHVDAQNNKVKQYLSSSNLDPNLVQFGWDVYVE